MGMSRLYKKKFILIFTSILVLLAVILPSLLIGEEKEKKVVEKVIVGNNKEVALTATENQNTAVSDKDSNKQEESNENNGKKTDSKSNDLKMGIGSKEKVEGSTNKKDSIGRKEDANKKENLSIHNGVTEDKVAGEESVNEYPLSNKEEVSEEGTVGAINEDVSEEESSSTDDQMNNEEDSLGNKDDNLTTEDKEKSSDDIAVNDEDVQYAYGISEQKHAYEPFKETNEKETNSESVAYREDRLLIKYKEAVSKTKDGKYQVSNKTLSIKEQGISKIEPLIPNVKVNKTGKKSKIEETLSGWNRAYIAKGKDLKDVEKSLKKDPAVVSVEFDYIRAIDTTTLPDETSDEGMTQQWFLESAGVKSAWENLNQQGINPGGSRDVVIAVIDTGVDYNHPDLKGNMWVNTAEIPNNGRDDDNNGFIDDIHGATTVGNSYNGESGTPLDDHGHGTHVAGIVAAQGGNDIGGVGVAYNTQIMAIKAAQSSGVLSSSDVAQAIYYAVEKGADVINMSFGGYGRSTVEEDALQVAFGSSVLVAAAGNDSTPNLPHRLGKDMYPAAYNWVLGVMAEQQTPNINGDYLAGFSNWDYKPQDSHEYEVMAPGAEIYSTLPNGKYAKWSGTSMAAPVVSGVAALVRSKFNDKSSYSSRFIMGQIAATGNLKQGITPEPNKPSIKYRSVNALGALTNTPKPKLSYLEHYVFDKPELAPENDGDGVVDAGETINLAMVIRNHWGKADNVKVKIDTLSSAGIADPYVTILTDTVDYGAVGTFAIDDNGLIYENDIITGVNLPFKMKVAPNTPNDHVVAINITLTANNGFDSQDTQVYSFGSGFSFMVRNGVELPGVIDTDMTLTKDKYWIVPNSTLIREGATVTVEPGTQIQFWSAEPEDPYAEKSMAYIEVRGKFLVNGTAEEPVEMFASSMYPGYEVKIYSTDSLHYYGYYNSYRGYAEINYAKIMNPNIAVQKVGHSYFSQDLFDRIFKRYLDNGLVETVNYTGPIVIADEISNSKFYNLGIGNTDTWEPTYLRVKGKSYSNLFDSSKYYMDEDRALNNVYLKNYKLYESQYGDRTYWMSRGKNFGSSINPEYVLQSSFPVKYNETGSTYVAVLSNIPFEQYQEFEIIEQYANELGGHIVTINDAIENEIVTNYKNTYLVNYPFSGDPVIGLHDFDSENDFRWVSGEGIAYTNWLENEPNNIGNSGETSVANFVKLSSSGHWYDYSYGNGVYIIEIPGISNVTGVTLDNPTMTLGAGGGQGQLVAQVKPVSATNKTVSWSSSNPEVATIDQNGYITPISVGKTTVTVTTEDGGFTATSEINVIEVVPTTGVTLLQDTLEISKGEQETLVANVLPDDSTDKRVTWGSSDVSVASVDQKGKVTGLTTGTSTITVTTEVGGFTDSITVSVVVPVEGIKLDKEFLRLVLGDEPVTLKPAIYPEDSTNKDIKWSSSNEAVVEVDETGAISAVGTGTAMITATSLNGGFTASSIVTVWDTQVSFNTKSISAGSHHTTAVNEDGTVWSWGSNESGQLGDGTRNNRLTPMKINNLAGIKGSSSGGQHTLALTNSGEVYSWGLNSYGQLGIGSSVYNQLTPLKIQNLTNVVSIDAGSAHSIALKSDGTVWTWGANYAGQLGHGTTIERSVPVQVPNLTNVISISAGFTHSLALKSDGTVWSWGNNDYGRLGDGTETKRLSPVQVKSLSNVKAISAGNMHSIALKNDGTIWGWGSNNNGQLGNTNNTWYNFTPVQAPGIIGIKLVSAGENHTIVLKDDNTVWSFGSNSYGQLGRTSEEYMNAPLQVEEVNASNVEAGYSHTLVTKSDGSVWSWGYNNYGQLGNLTTENISRPVQTLFGILPDNEIPNLLSTYPADNSIGIDVNSSIVFKFNEGIKQGDNFPLITLKDHSNNIISLRSKTIDNNILILEPINGLTENTNYTVTIPANSIVDVFNNSYSSDIYLQFSTAENQEVANVLKAVAEENETETEALPPLDMYTALNDSIEDSRLDSGVMDSPELVSETLSDDANSTDTESIEITQEFLDSKRIAFINSGALSTVKNNAILNRWWDPNVDHWMRFTSETGEQNKRMLSGNYWGTTSTELIEKSLIHFNDFRNMEEIIFQPILTDAPETAYPFVNDVYVSTDTQDRATKVGAENINIHVKFNRDMDQTKQPQVSFGPDMPTTDYTVHGVNGGWVSPREWVGSARISALTGDGYQFFRVAGAVAADDPWLVTGNDTERFRFEIVTSGTEAMNLQASGAEGQIILSWTQDDFDTLAGYNLYRSESKDGAYIKINNSIIPADQKTYEDKNVTPGKTYYYKFTVVETSLTESEFSNIASAAPIDTIMPVISHVPVKQANVGQSIQIFADVTDNLKVDTVTMYYRLSTQSEYASREMVKSTNNRYSTTLESSLVKPQWIDYYIEATDGISKAQNGNPNLPHRIVVSDKPSITSVTPNSGPESGGTKVIINGANFKDGASVLFGQAVASNVIVESANKITAEAPAHYPAKVDITVNNPDGTKGSLLGGFTYISEGVQLSIPNVSANRGELVEVPVLISNVSGIRSADFKVQYDSKLLEIQDVKIGDITNGFSIASNKNNLGEVIVSMASSTSVKGSGTLAKLIFKVLESELTTSTLTLDGLSFNSGSIKVVPVNGLFNISKTYNVGGKVRYYSNYKSVNNVQVDLSGKNQFTSVSDLNGMFKLTGVESGSYKMKPDKTDEINGISAYDASLILQASVGLNMLSDYQKIAADVDGNGQINSLDAAYVLEKSVDLLTLPFPGVGKVWAFAPNEKNIDLTTTDLYYQDFTAILIGDVNGDWGSESNFNMSSLYKVGEATAQTDGMLVAPVEFNVGDAELYSAKLQVKYDSNIVKPISIDKTDATQNYNIVYNTVADGIIEIAIAGATPLKGEGNLLNIAFEPISKKVKTAIVQLEKGNFNDKNIIVKALKANKDSHQSVNTKINWTADVLGQGLTYSWVLYKDSVAVAKQNYSKQNYYEHTFKTPGTYSLLMIVKDANGELVSKFSEDIIVSK